MKKTIITTISMLIVSSLFANTTVSLVKPSADNTSIVNVAVQSNEDVYGLQFDIKYDPSVLSIDAADLASLVPGVDQVYGRVKSEGVLRVVMFDLNGSPLHASKGSSSSVISIPFSNDSKTSINTLVEFDNLVVAGTNGSNIESSSSSLTVQIDDILPSETTLKPAFPNPFNPSTTIAYEIAAEGKVSIQVYDLKGSLVRTLVSEFQSQDEYSVVWNGRDDAGRKVATGEYFVRMSAPGYTKNIKISLIK